MAALAPIRWVVVGPLVMIVMMIIKVMVMNMIMMTRCVVVGPPRSGKSSMLLNITTGETSDETKEHIPTVFDNYATKIDHAGKQYELR